MNFSQALEAMEAGKRAKIDDIFYFVEKGIMHAFSYITANEIFYDIVKNIPIDRILSDKWEIAE